MKKTVLILLVLAMFVGVFASCTDNKPNESTTPDESITDESTPLTESAVSELEATSDEPSVNEDLIAAKDFLVAMYNDNGSVTETAADYTLTRQIQIAGVVYAIEWTVNVPETDVKIVDGDDTANVTIDLNEKTPTAISYELKATISDNNGQTVEYTFKRSVPAYFESGWQDYADACKANDTNANVTVTAYVIGIVAAPTSSSKGSIWLQDASGKGYYAYAQVLDTAITASREAMVNEFPIGTEVTVSGTVTVYNGCFEFNKGCAVVKTGKTAADNNVTLGYTDATADFAKAASNQDAETLDKYQSARITIKGVTLEKADGSYYYFTVGDSKVQFNVYKNNYILEDNVSNDLFAKWQEGSKADITGIVNVYSKSFQIYPDSVDSVKIIAQELTDDERVADAKERLTLNAKYRNDFDLPAQGAHETSITWAVKQANDALTVNGTKATVKPQTEEKSVVLVATIKFGTSVATKEITVTVEAAALKLSTFAELRALIPNANDTTTEKYYTTGMIKEIQNDKYGNILIEDESGDTFLIYGTYSADGSVRYDSLTNKPQVGDRIVVCGALKNYNGTFEMANGAVLKLNGEEFTK